MIRVIYNVSFRGTGILQYACLQEPEFPGGIGMMKRLVSQMVSVVVVMFLLVGPCLADPISIWVKARPEAPYNNDMPIIKEIIQRTGVELKWELAPSDDDQAREKFNLMVASDDLADVIVHSIDDIDKISQRGLLAPLNDLIDQHAPNLKKILEENPTIAKQLKSEDGNYYYLPFLGAVRTLSVFIIRQDWLDKLNLEAPETLDDWYTVLKAFKEQDPNGNGEADEVPFATRGKLNGILRFMEAWGLGMNGNYEIYTEEGQVRYPFIDPRFKEVLVYMNKLYSEGLIDPEYATADKNQWTSRLTNEVSGVTHDVFVRVDYFNKAIQGVNPNVQFTGVLPPVGPAGVPMTTSQQNPIRKATAISAKAENKEDIVKFFDYLYGEEGNLLANFGVEGMHYDMIDGNPVYKPEVINHPEKSLLFILFEAGHVEWAYKQDIRYENQLVPEDVIAVRDMYVPYIAPPFPTLAYTDDEYDILNEKYTEIKTYKDEMVNKFIMGKEPIEKFEKFVAQIEKMGVADVLAVHQAALERFNAR
jgi:putative aldouronate transport system substrate-binding protein